jgi:signal transduction histidine kinase/CheY-like chemotaxis protein
MRRILIIVYSAFVLILFANYFYYNNLYNNQIDYIKELLSKQVGIVGHSVDATNNGFISDLNKINFEDDLSKFFTDDKIQYRVEEKMKLFFSKYQDFVIGIKFYDNKKNEYTLKKDGGNDSNEWLPNYTILRSQAEIFNMERLVEENRRFNYYLPVIDRETNEIIGNIVVTVDYKKYFTEIFTVFNLETYQWQWVLSDSGEIILSNLENRKIEYTQLKQIGQSVFEGATGNIVHKANIDGKSTDIISSFYSTNLLGQELGLVFSAPTDFFQKRIIRNSLFIVLGTLLLIQIIIFAFLGYLKSQKKEMSRLMNSETMLFRLIEDMPVGVIIHKNKGEILKANKVAATQFSFASEKEMQGEFFPETNVPGNSEYFSKNLGSTFSPDQFLIINKENGEIVLFRYSIPVSFMGNEAIMEILIDVTMLESARKQEALSNSAKSEFLARMSYEIRTPLNGIVGMADVLSKFNLSREVNDIIGLMRRSSEVLLNIVNGILDISKIESGKMLLKEAPYNIREEIYYCIDLARTNVSISGLDIVCVIDEQIPESVIGDPIRLRQVLINLLNNSVKNTEKGEIRLKCELISKNDRVITLGFELLDTGTGFDKASLNGIFGDIVNTEIIVDRKKDESFYGTILARQLVELMGGKLKAVSPSGLSGNSGLKVSFDIIVCSNEKPVKEIPLVNIKTFENIKTMVITGGQNRDEEILSALHRLGLTVTVTSFMKTTVPQIKANLKFPDLRYNLIVLIDDKDFNGFDAAKQIWENNISGNFIILMISSNNLNGNYMKCNTMGIDHYLVKPFETGDLLKIVNDSFPFLEDPSSSSDTGIVKKDIKILVVEDNKMNQIVIGKMLNTIGFSYDIAENGYAGYLQAKIKKYDLIFMDLIMPEMDGFEASQKILAYDKSVIIIAFTADNMPESKKKAELSGIRDFISKPVRMEELKKLLLKYFS